MVPNGWREGRVRDLIKSLNAGVSVNSEDDGNLSSSYKILKTSCVSKGIFDPNKTKSVVEDVEISRLKEPVLCDSIIISRMNTPALVGANGYIENGIENTYLPDRLWQAKPKSNDVNMKWLGYWFASSHTRYTLSSTATGTSGSMKNITKSDVLNIKIDIPPLPEQRKIATILGTWDKAISTTERLIDNSKQQKKALMQQLLTGKKRLLDDSGKPFEGEWEEVKLSKVAEIVMGSSPKSSSYNESSEGLPLIQGNADIKNRKSAPRIYTSEVTKKCSVGDILLSVRAPVGTIAKSEHVACIGRGISAVRAKKHHVQEYLYQWLLWFEPRWEKYSQGSTFEAVNSNDIKSLHLIVPTYTEQAKIASVLSNADQEIELLEQQLADLKQEKKALMQQLLTGKRRVIVDEKDVA
tara:strand:+ start:1868 stop:3097 length:1230 start_codon:yes stop_codon:yes gene_type:complete